MSDQTEDLQTVFQGSSISIKMGGLIHHAFKKHGKEMGARTIKAWIKLIKKHCAHGTMVPSTPRPNKDGEMQDRWVIKSIANPHRVLYVANDNGEWIACTMFDRSKQKKPTVHQRKLSKHHK